MEWSRIDGLRKGNRLEAKLARGGIPASLWETYSAFANTEGGTILLGVRERADGSLEVEGLSDAAKLVKKFWDAVNNPAKVSANILTNADVAIHREGDREFVRLEVPRAPRQARPVFVGKDQMRGTYRRNGEGDYHCSPDEIVAMVRDASPAPLDAMVLENFDLSALDKGAVERFRAAMEAVRPGHPWTRLGWEDLLLKLNAAGRGKGDRALHPTRAGLLMFGYEYEIVREYPEYFLDYREMGEGARWTDRVVSNDGSWSGCVFDFWTMVLPRLTGGVKRPFAMGASLRRIEDTEMHAAIREAFVNALVHADYYGRRGIVALRYGDRVEVANPGSLRVALDVVLAGGVSDARNPTMMKMFGLVNACEKAGSGFDVMRRAAEGAQAKLPVVEERFSPDQVAVKVFLGAAAATAREWIAQGEADFGNRESGGSFLAGHAAREVEPEAERVAYSEKDAILQLGGQAGEFTRRDVERLLGCGPTKAKGLLAALLEAGEIAVEGIGRSTRYRLTP